MLTDYVQHREGAAVLNGYAGVPEELRRRAQWLCFRLQPTKGDKVDKIPTDPDVKQNVSKTNPNNWLTFERACIAAHSQKHLSGIRYFLDKRDPFTVIDLDSEKDDGNIVAYVRNPDTGVIVEWAQAIIDQAASYTEVSPSGTGVHIWIYGSVWKTTRPVVDGHQVEVYSRNKFMSVTGNHILGTPTEIVNARTC